MRKFFLLCFFVPCLALAAPILNLTTSQQPLPATQAFQFKAQVNAAKQLLLQWEIAPGYQLYRDQIIIQTTSSSTAELGPYYLPDGVSKKDTAQGLYQAYVNTLALDIPLNTEKGNTLVITVRYQGCSDQGFCYPPITKTLQVLIDKQKATQSLVPTQAVPHTVKSNPPTTPQDTVTQQLKAAHGIWIILLFFGFGFLLAFTPCVLPMIPILSSIIIGKHQTPHTRRAFGLSLAFVCGVAIAYAITGLVAGFLGASLQTVFQSSWLISCMTLIFIAMALSLFGLFELQFPSFIRHHAALLSQRIPGGTYLGTFTMGALSLLVVSPCVSAPLIGALTYIAHIGDAFMGGLALFAMGFGMGVPLLLIGTFSGKILPKSGAWMVTIKRAFGIVMLLMAIWTASRLPLFTPTEPTPCATGLTCEFTTIETQHELDTMLEAAKAQHTPVLLMFYADWCRACHDMTNTVFTQPDVALALQGFMLLQVDLTAPSPAIKQIEYRYKVIAPPTILFFDANGKRLALQSLGLVSPKIFLGFLNYVQNIKTLDANDA